MNFFITQTNLAKEAFAQKNYQVVLHLLSQGIQTDTWNENESFVLTHALPDVLALTEQMLGFPEFKKTEFVRTTLENTRLCLDNFLEDDEEYEELSLAVYDLFRLIQALDGGVKLLEKRGILLGDQTKPSIGFGVKQTDEGKLTVHLYGKISEQAGGMSREEAQELQNEFFNMFQIGSDARLDLLNMASTLSTGGHYPESNECLDKIIEKYPQDKGNCLNMIGANHFFMGDFETALEYYKLAAEAGADPEMIEYNIWESCVELIKLHPDASAEWRRYYLDHYPNPQYSL